MSTTKKQSTKQRAATVARKGKRGRNSGKTAQPVNNTATNTEVKTTVPDAATIITRAMLVSLSISQWTGKRWDREVTRKVNQQHGVDEKAGRYKKNLLAGINSKLQQIASANAALRALHHEHTTPWSRDGWCMLPTANYDAYTTAVRTQIQLIESLVELFIAEFPSKVAEARKRLGPMFKDEDYPSPNQLRRKFGVYIDFSPIPSGKDFRLSLPAEQLEEMERTVTARVQKQVEQSMQDVWRRLYKYVDRFVARMDGDSVIRESLVDDATELTTLLDRLNVTQDPNFAALSNRVATELGKHSAQTLREDDKVRQQAESQAKDILKQMATFYTPVTDEDDDDTDD